MGTYHQLARSRVQDLAEELFAEIAAFEDEQRKTLARLRRRAQTLNQSLGGFSPEPGEPTALRAPEAA